MKALVLLCHPNRTGFNHAIAQAAVSELRKTHQVTFVDLYRESFDPLITQEEIQRRFSFDDKTLHYNNMVKESDLQVYVHPDWWGGPPALLKGFIDRVFRPGVAYDFEGNEFLTKVKTALFEGKKAIVFNTTDYKRPDGLYPPAEIWRRNVFDYCGIPDAEVHTFFDTYNSTYEARHEWILSVGAKIKALLNAKSVEPAASGMR